MSNSRSTSLSVVAEAWIQLDGKDFRLTDWPMHRAFYDGRYRRTLFKTARQVAKSTTLANFSIIECSLIPHFSTMFVSPSKEQTTRFSNTRIGKTMRYSPIINEQFLRTDLADRVFHKQFTNGSEMLFTYGCDDAERLRGPSTDRNMYDEVQDILYDPVITVGNETMAESDYAFETYAGTPKTMENTIQYLWELSTRSEWVMKCDGCGSHVFVDSEKCLGKYGPVCPKCKHYLNPFTGQWIDMVPSKKLQGFHISQPMMPRNVPLAMRSAGRSSAEVKQAELRWERILQKFEETPLSTFRNEVLGVSDEIGSRLLSQEELESLCTGDPLQQFPDRKALQGITQIVAGADWSGGGTTGVSRTVLWIWGWRPVDQKLITLFYKVYPGTNPVTAVEEIALVCKQYQVSMFCGDAGEGALANDLMRTHLGHHRVIQVQYGMQAKALKFNQVDRYTGDRTTLIDNYFMMLKQKKIEFGPLAEMRVAINDILNEYEDVTHTDRKVWRHSPQKPDDCLHAGLFGWLAWKIINKDFKFWQE
ncbi:MAG: hypothetical protein DRP83_00380 [Planctomycetota bacterium]|nr:MAG: hypothetical protein DRP83_00380 [Planctomycetota bacterium]